MAMILIGLQLSAGFLFAFWMAVSWALLRGTTVSELFENDTPLIIPEHVQIYESKNHLIIDPLIKWKAMLLSPDGLIPCREIIINSSWNKASDSYQEFQRLCDTTGIEFIQLEQIMFPKDHPVVYFDDTRHLPYLWEQYYVIHAVNGKTLKDLLDQTNPFSIILISVKDDGSQALNHKWQESLFGYGIRALTREHLRHSYVNIIWKKTEFTMVNLFEEVSSEELSICFHEGDKLNNFVLPFDLTLISAGMDSGNRSSIRINGNEYSKNARGMNIVVYDLVEQQVKDVTVVDSFVTIYLEDTIYKATSEEIIDEFAN